MHNLVVNFRSLLRVFEHMRLFRPCCKMQASRQGSTSSSCVTGMYKNPAHMSYFCFNKTTWQLSMRSTQSSSNHVPLHSIVRNFSLGIKLKMSMRKMKLVWGGCKRDMLEAVKKSHGQHTWDYLHVTNLNLVKKSEPHRDERFLGHDL